MSSGPEIKLVLLGVGGVGKVPLGWRIGSDIIAWFGYRSSRL
jgi:GTPase SAR1 family protein